MDVQTHTPDDGAQTRVTRGVDAKQGTNVARGMPMVLTLGIAGTIAGFFLVWQFGLS